MQSLRVFVAVDVPVTPAIDSFIDQLSQLPPPAKVVDPRQLHLTVRFLGDIDRSQVESIGGVIDEVAKSAVASNFELIGLGAFPNRNRPRVLWIGVQDTANRLSALAEKLDAHLIQLGFEPESRSFQSHVTVGRIKLGYGRRHRPIPEGVFELLARHEATEFGILPVATLKLYQSELTADGPQYRILSAAKLGA